jgi:hypothetical protein
MWIYKSQLELKSKSERIKTLENIDENIIRSTIAIIYTKTARLPFDVHNFIRENFQIYKFQLPSIYVFAFLRMKILSKEMWRQEKAEIRDVLFLNVS